MLLRMTVCQSTFSSPSPNPKIRLAMVLTPRAPAEPQGAQRQQPRHAPRQHGKIRLPIPPHDPKTETRTRPHKLILRARPAHRALQQRSKWRLQPLCELRLPRLRLRRHGKSTSLPSPSPLPSSPHHNLTS